MQQGNQSGRKYCNAREWEGGETEKNKQEIGRVGTKRVTEKETKNEKKKVENEKEEYPSCSLLFLVLSKLRVELRPIVPECKFVSEQRNPNTTMWVKTLPTT